MGAHRGGGDEVPGCLETLIFLKVHKNRENLKISAEIISGPKKRHMYDSNQYYNNDEGVGDVNDYDYVKGYDDDDDVDADDDDGDDDEYDDDDDDEYDDDDGGDDDETIES